MEQARGRGPQGLKEGRKDREEDPVRLKMEIYEKTLIGVLTACIILFTGCVDTRAPVIEFLGDPGETWINTTSGTLVYMATDDSGETLTCRIELNGAIISTIEVESGVQTEEPMTLIQGTNSIRIHATDKAGNSAWSDTYIVHVDAVPPEVVIIDFLASQ